MPRFIFISFLFLLVIFTVATRGVTYAQSDPAVNLIESPTTTEDIATSTSSTTESAEKVVETRGTLPPPNPNIRALLPVRAQERIVNLAANLSNRQEATIRRLDNVSDRLTTRLQTLEAEGRDMTEAWLALQTTERTLSEASAQLRNIDTDVIRAITSENPRLAWQTVRSTYTNTRDIIIRAHSDLRTALAITKSLASAPLLSTETPIATSSDTTATTPTSE